MNIIDLLKKNITPNNNLIESMEEYYISFFSKNKVQQSLSVSLQSILSYLNNKITCKENYKEVIRKCIFDLNIFNSSNVPNGVFLTGSYIRYLIFNTPFKEEDVDKTINIYLYNNFDKTVFKFDTNLLNKTDFGYQLTINNTLINIYNRVYKNIEHIFAFLLLKKTEKKIDIYELIGYNNEDVFMTQSYVAYLMKLSENYNNIDPILNKYHDGLNITTKKCNNIFDSINTFNISEFSNQIKKSHNCIHKNLTVIEQIILNYNLCSINNKNEMLKNICLDMMKICQNMNLKFIRNPIYIYKLLDLHDCNVENIIKNINFQYNILGFTTCIYNNISDTINRQIIHDFIKFKKLDELRDYLLYFDYKFTKDDYDIIIKYNSRDTLKYLIIENKIDIFDAFHTIYMTDSIDLFSLYSNNTEIKLTEIINYGLSISNELIKNNKFISYYFIYKNYPNILSKLYENNNTPLHIIENKCINIMNLLIKLDKDFLYKNNNLGQIPFYRLIDKDLDILINFIKYDYDFDFKDKENNNILHHCCKYGRYDLINYLIINHEPKINNLLEQQNDDLETPLILSAINKHENIIYLLLSVLCENKKDIILLVDKHGNSVYHYICKNNLCIGMDIINNKNKYGFRPSDYSKIDNKLWTFIDN